MFLNYTGTELCTRIKRIACIYIKKLSLPQHFIKNSMQCYSWYLLGILALNQHNTKLSSGNTLKKWTCLLNMTSIMLQDKYPLLDILTSSVFEIVCCSIKQLRCSRKVAGEKKEWKKSKKGGEEKGKG